MSLTSFIQLIKLPGPQRHFFENYRRTGLRALSVKFPYASGEDLEDALFDTLEALLLDKITAFNSEHAFSSELFQQDLIRYLAYYIAPRKLIDLYRKKKVDRFVDLGSNHSDDEIESFLDELIGEQAPSAESEYENQQISERLMTCITHLPEKLRAVIHLVIQGLQQKDISAQLGLSSTGTVKSRQWEAVRQLKDCMFGKSMRNNDGSI